jgi:hypothetical protein
MFMHHLSMRRLFSPCLVVTRTTREFDNHHWALALRDESDWDNPASASYTIVCANRQAYLCIYVGLNAPSPSLLSFPLKSPCTERHQTSWGRCIFRSLPMTASACAISWISDGIFSESVSASGDGVFRAMDRLPRVEYIWMRIMRSDHVFQ